MVSKEDQIINELTIKYRTHREFVKWLIKRLDEAIRYGEKEKHDPSYMLFLDMLVKEARSNYAQATYDSKR